MQLVVETEGKIYEISELVHSVSFTDKLNNGCSKLEFSYINDNVVITNGSIVQFIYNEIKFYGIVFKVNRNAKGEIDVTAYDQLRYAKAKDTIVSKDDTITTLTKKMCNYLKLSTGTLKDTMYKLPLEVHDDRTWLDIIYSAISDTLTNTGKWYMLRDEYGTVCIRDVDDYRLNLVLGDDSLCYDYDYQKSIDENTYNVIKLVSDDKKAGQSVVYVADDKTSIKKYGVLQYFEVLDKGMNNSQVKSKAEMLLKLYNREYETLSLECLGDANVRAGCNFYAKISDIAMEKWMIVRSVTHKFIPSHTMSIEVMI